MKHNNKPEWIDTVCTRERRILDLRSIGMRHALSLGHLHYHRASAPLAEQCHKDWLVLVFSLSGQQQYRVDDREVAVHGGEMLRILPGQRYGTGPWPEQKGDLAWLILKPRPLHGGTALGMSAADAKSVFSLLADPAGPAVRPMPKDAPQWVESAFAWWARRDEPLGREMVRNRITTLLLESAAADISGTETADQANRRRIDRALQWMARHDYEDISTGELARLSGLSLPAFHHHFKIATGSSPKDYLLRIRVARAASWLRDHPELSVTRAAHEFGFASSQYFSVVFRRYMGVSPTAHRGNPCHP